MAAEEAAGAEAGAADWEAAAERALEAKGSAAAADTAVAVVAVVVATATAAAGSEVAGPVAQEGGVAPEVCSWARLEGRHLSIATGCRVLSGGRAGVWEAAGLEAEATEAGVTEESSAVGAAVAAAVAAMGQAVGAG